MTPVIQVENLAKRYLIGHRRQQGYQTLRDTMSRACKDLGRRLLHPVQASSGQPLPGAAETEEFWALEDICFSVSQGDRLAIIGRNGAGKSTLLKILSRITEPTRGRARIRGRVASLLEVGTGFHPELSGRENIFLNGAVLGMGKEEIKRKFDEIVAFAGVERFLDTPVKRYSSGMYVRLAFSVAAHIEPEILIVDEVLAVGDVQFQEKCLGKMDEIGREGRTVLFVSHNMPAVKKLCQKGLLLKNGRVAQSGDVAEVVDAYLAMGPESTFSSTVTSDMHEVPSPDLEVTRLLVVDEKGQPQNRVQMFEPIRLKIFARVQKPAHHYVLEVRIHNREGSLLAVVNSGEFLLMSDFAPGSDHCFEVEMNNVLSPGQYRFSLKIKEGQRFIDRIEGLPLNISDISVNQAVPNREGLVQLAAKWSLLS